MVSISWEKGTGAYAPNAYFHNITKGKRGKVYDLCAYTNGSMAGIKEKEYLKTQIILAIVDADLWTLQQIDRFIKNIKDEG